MKIGRNQFLFTRRGDLLPKIDCEKTLIVEEYAFFLGRDCSYVQALKGNRKLVLLGYCVNTEILDESGQQMCNQLLSDLDEECTNVAELTQSWGGRWVAFAHIHDRWHIWNDACGLKQCFCYEEGSLTVASQARYISWLYALPEHPAALEYIEAAMKMDKEYCWPVDATRYQKVIRLLPNHLWKQGNCRATRMKNILPPIEGGSSASKSMALLSSTMQGAAAHKPLILTLTAGWDSRLVLAACRALKKEVRCLTLQYANMPDTHPDIRIARELAASMGVDHTVRRCAIEDRTFVAEYRAHSENSHDYWIQMAQETHLGGYGGALWVKGACNEILRNPNGVLYDWQVGPKILCKLFQLPQTKFSLKALNRWLESARPYCKKNSIRLLDLFYWEHRMGSWLAECLNEADIASDMFSPFNVRNYLSVGYQVPLKQRMAPRYEYFTHMLQESAPECAQVPINNNRYRSAKARAKLLLKNRLHLLYGILLKIR